MNTRLRDERGNFSTLEWTGPEVDEIIVDSYEVYTRAKEFLHGVMPRYEETVKFYSGPTPLFHKYHVEQQIESLQATHVPLPSGGSLVIEQTEALVAIDVNSGKFKGEKNLEETAYRTNLIVCFAGCCCLSPWCYYCCRSWVAGRMRSPMSLCGRRFVRI